MRHWQPVHHARWRAFLGALGAALRGEPVPGIPPATAAAPVVAVVVPAQAVPTPPAPTPETDRIAPSAVSADTTEHTASPPPVADEPQVATIAETEQPLAAVVDLPPVREAESAPPPAPLPVETKAIPAPAVVAPAPVTPTPPPAAQIAGSSARSFFAALSWSGGPARATTVMASVTSVAPIAPAPSLVVVPSIQPPEADTPKDSSRVAGSFFRRLPWLGGVGIGEVITSIRVTAARDDAGLDPRTASLPADNPLLTGMLSAARTSDRLASAAARPPSGRARAFFSAIPWARS